MRPIASLPRPVAAVTLSGDDDCFFPARCLSFASAMQLHLDHLVFAAPTLEEGCDHLEKLLGRRPLPGGRHPGLGTHNALLGLGPGVYLEVIAPDPAQAGLDRAPWMGSGRVTAPRLIRWAAKAGDLPALLKQAGAAGIDLGSVSGGSRQRPDGSMLSWQLTDPDVDPGDGVIPFFIDWGASPHPAATLPKVATCRGLRAEHPRAAALRKQLAILGLELPVAVGDQPRLIAELALPGGRTLLLR